MSKLEMMEEMRGILADFLFMPEFDGTVETSIVRANAKRRARKFLHKLDEALKEARGE